MIWPSYKFVLYILIREGCSFTIITCKKLELSFNPHCIDPQFILPALVFKNLTSTRHVYASTMHNFKTV